MKISVCLNYSTIIVGLFLTVLNVISITYKAKYNYMKSLDELRMNNFHVGKCTTTDHVTIFTPNDPNAVAVIAKYTPDYSNALNVDCYLNRFTQGLVLKKEMSISFEASENFNEFYLKIVEYYCKHGINVSILLYFVLLAAFLIESLRERPPRNQYPKTISGKKDDDDDKNNNDINEKLKDI